jgi:hypothetical protein
LFFENCTVDASISGEGFEILPFGVGLRVLICDLF